MDMRHIIMTVMMMMMMMIIIIIITLTPIRVIPEE
jgi:hypothetical protein